MSPPLGSQVGINSMEQIEKKEKERKGGKMEKEGGGNERKNQQVLPPTKNASIDGIQQTEKQSSSMRR